MTNSKILRRFCLTSVFLLSLWSGGSAADNAVETILHSFAASANVYRPFTGLDGNLYGRTGAGGTNNRGVFYRLSIAGDYTEIYQFAASEGKGNLIQGADGNFYGTDATGGTSQNGSIYRLTTAGVRTTVFDFGDGSKGVGPQSILQIGNGDFYGVFKAQATSVVPTAGDVYRLASDGSLTTVYLAANHAGSPANTLTSPANTLTLGGDGNLYGLPTVFADGDSGALVKIVPGGDAGVLHRFSSTDGSGINADGSHPNGVAVGQDGVVYGTTSKGGANGTGTFFRVSPDGTLTVPRAFEAPSYAQGELSNLEFTLLLQGLDGNFYGVVNTVDEGVVANYYTGLFEIAPNGTLTAPLGPSFEQVALPRQLADGSFYYLNFFNEAQAQRLEVVRLVFSDKPYFFNREMALGHGAYYLPGDSGIRDKTFGYYGYLADPHYLYHFDLGYEYLFDSPDGIYLYDFASGTFFYTGAYVPFPYLYDFSLKTVLYYYPDPDRADRYTSGPRYFYNFATGSIITK